MNAALWLTGPLAERWTLVLLHFLWQGAAVAALLLVALSLLRLSSRGRYLVAVAALVLLALCPLATLVLLPGDAPVAIAAPSAIRLAAIPESTLPSPTAESAARAPVDSSRFAEVRELLRLSAVELAHWDKLTGRELQQVAQPWLLLVWLGGSALLSLRLAAGLLGMLRLAASGEPVEPEWEARLAALGRKLGLRRLPRLCVSCRVSEATVLGFLRPLVLLPAVWLTELPCDAVEAVLAHELAHLRRWDLWVNLGQRIVETLLFFHPAVWWISRRIRVEREMCCDELAVAVTGRRREYAEALELVARQKCSGPRPAFAAGIGDDQMALLERVRNVLGLVGAQRASRAWLAGLVSLVVLAGAALASLSSSEHEVTAWIQVDRAPTPSAQYIDPRESDEFRHRQLATVKSDLVLLSALRADGNSLSNSELLRGVDHKVRWLKDHLKVGFNGESDVMFLSLKGQDPRQQAKAVNAIAKAYLAEVAQGGDSSKTEFTALKAQLSDALKSIQSQKDRLNAIMKSNGSPDREAAAAREQIALHQLAALQNSENLLKDQLRQAVTGEAGGTTDTSKKLVDLARELADLQERYDRQSLEVKNIRDANARMEEIVSTLTPAQKQVDELSAKIENIAAQEQAAASRIRLIQFAKADDESDSEDDGEANDEAEAKEPADDVAAELRAAREELEAERAALREELEALRAAHQQELDALRAEIEQLRAGRKAESNDEADDQKDDEERNAEEASSEAADAEREAAEEAAAAEREANEEIAAAEREAVEERASAEREAAQEAEQAAHEEAEERREAEDEARQAAEEVATAEREAAEESAAAEREAAEELAQSEREAAEEAENAAREAAEEQAEQQREADEETQAAATEAEQEAKEAAQEQREAAEETEQAAREAQEEAAAEQEDAAREAAEAQEEAKREAAEAEQEAKAEAAEAEQEAKAAAEEAKQEAEEEAAEAKEEIEEESKDDEAAIDIKIDVPEIAEDGDNGDVPVLSDLKQLGQLFRRARSMDPEAQEGRLGQLAELLDDAMEVAHDAAGGINPKWQAELEQAQQAAQQALGEAQRHAQEGLATAQRATAQALVEAQKQVGAGDAEAQAQVIKALEQAQREIEQATHEAERATRAALDDANRARREARDAQRNAHRDSASSADRAADLVKSLVDGEAEGLSPDQTIEKSLELLQSLRAKREGNRAERGKRLDAHRAARDLQRQKRKVEADAKRAKHDDASRKDARAEDVRIEGERLLKDADEDRAKAAQKFADESQRLDQVKKSIAESMARAKQDAAQAAADAKAEAAKAIARAEKQIAEAKEQAAREVADAQREAGSAVEAKGAAAKQIERAQQEAEKAAAAAMEQAKQAIAVAEQQAKAAADAAHRQAKDAARAAEGQAKLAHDQELKAKADKDRTEKDAKAKSDKEAKADKDKKSSKDAKADKEAKASKNDKAEQDFQDAKQDRRERGPRIVRKELRARLDPAHKTARRDRMQQLIKELHVLQGDGDGGALEQLMNLVGKEGGDSEAARGAEEALERANREFEKRVQGLQEQNKILLEQHRAAERDGLSKREAQLKEALDQKVKALETRERELREKLRDAEQRAEEKFQEKIKERDAKEKGDKPEKKGEQAQAEEARVFLQAGDLLTIMAAGVLPDQPIASTFQIQPDGSVDLGTSYGAVSLMNQSLEDARTKVQRHLSNRLRKYGLEPKVSVSFAGHRAETARLPSRLGELQIARPAADEDAEYRVGVSDILLVDAVRLVPKRGTLIQADDVLDIDALNVPPDRPLEGKFKVHQSGLVDLGEAYWSVKLQGLTVEEASAAVTEHLKEKLADRGLTPEAHVTLHQHGQLHKIAGDHMVGHDGLIELGPMYGAVHVAGKTIPEAKQAIETHLAKFLDRPLVSIDMLAYNSQVFYLQIRRPNGQDVLHRIPFTGNANVSDAVDLAVGSLGPSGELRSISVLRPLPGGSISEAHVDVQAIAHRAPSATDYRVAAGDRVVVELK